MPRNALDPDYGTLPGRPPDEGGGQVPNLARSIRAASLAMYNACWSDHLFPPERGLRSSVIAVSEAIGDRCGRAGESLKNNDGSPMDSLPTVERGSELVVLPVANLKVRIVAR